MDFYTAHPRIFSCRNSSILLLCTLTIWVHIADVRVAAPTSLKLTRDFGATPITADLIERFEKVTRHKAHRFMRELDLRGFADAC
jgi:hypothetical protein